MFPLFGGIRVLEVSGFRNQFLFGVGKWKEMRCKTVSLFGNFDPGCDGGRLHFLYQCRYCTYLFLFSK